MPKQRLFLITGIVLALIAVIMVKAYIDQQRQEIKAQALKALGNLQANQTAVLVAKRDIPRGTVIDSDMLENQIVPNKYLQPQAVTSLDRIAGMTTVTSISAGEQVTLSKLMWSREAAGSSLAMATPVGKRAITVSVDNVAALAGMLNPGDYVDVLAAVPEAVKTAEGKELTRAVVMPVFQNVLVLAVGRDLGEPMATSGKAGRSTKDEKKEISPLITIALTPQESNLVTFLQEQGKISLALRSPSDSKIESVTPASWETLTQYLMAKQANQSEESSGQHVEIRRGLIKEKVPLAK